MSNYASIAWGPISERTDDRSIGDGSFVETMFVETMLLALNNECYGVVLDERIATLNGEHLPDGHRFAILDADGHTLGTGMWAQDAVEAACIREIKRLKAHADGMEVRLRRVIEAVNVIRNGGQAC